LLNGREEHRRKITGHFEGTLHSSPELDDSLVEPVVQGQILPALTLEVRSLLQEPVLFKTQEDQLVAALARED
jgi:hypothetical protein